MGHYAAVESDAVGEELRLRRLLTVSCAGGEAGPSTESACPLCLQCVEELSALLRSRALLLPSLKLLLESPDARLHAMALEHVAAVAQVCLPA